VSIGINLSITEYQNAKNFLLINDDVQILDDYLENMQFEIKNLPKKTIIYSMIKEKANPALFLETGTIFDKKIKKDTVVPRTRYVKRDLCTARGTFYPRDLFLEKNIFFNYRLFPHHYADMMLSHRAVRKGYNIIGMKEIFILSENNFSSEFSSKNYFERYFGKSSPQRIWSVLLFWILYWI
jgi:GT2 family glycosyltransferase